MMWSNTGGKQNMVADSYYYTPKTCWLHSYAFLAGYVAIVGVIVLFIFAICFLASKTISGRNQYNNEVILQNRHHLYWMGIFTLLHLSAWVGLFGFWKTEGKGIVNQVFQYLFVAVNSLQVWFCFWNCFD